MLHIILPPLDRSTTTSRLPLGCARLLLTDCFCLQVEAGAQTADRAKTVIIDKLGEL